MTHQGTEDDDLPTLRGRVHSLQRENAARLAAVLLQLGADEIDPDILAGLVVSELKDRSASRMEAWRRAGQALFRKRRVVGAATSGSHDGPPTIAAPGRRTPVRGRRGVATVA
jgi:hypothetical protein